MLQDGQDLIRFRSLLKIIQMMRRYDFSVKAEITLSIIVAKLGRTSVLGYYL